MGDLLRITPAQGSQTSTFDVRDLIDQVVETLASVLAKRDIQVEVDAPPYTMLCADRKVLGEVLSCLIERASGLTPLGGEVVITVYNECDGVDVEVAEGSEIFARELDQPDPAGISARLRVDPQMQVLKQAVARMAGKLEVIECADGAVAFNVHLPRSVPAGHNSRKAA